MPDRWPDPDVLVRAPVATVPVYTEGERAQVEGVLEEIRKGGEPVAIIYRRGGGIHVHARSKMIPTPAAAQAIFAEALERVVRSLFRQAAVTRPGGAA